MDAIQSFFTDLDWTTVTAVYGAILATITAAWALRRDLQDRVSVRVSCSPAQVYPYRGVVMWLSDFGKIGTLGFRSG